MKQYINMSKQIDWREALYMSICAMVAGNTKNDVGKTPEPAASRIVSGSDCYKACPRSNLDNLKWDLVLDLLRKKFLLMNY
jgi:hypothetical protein